MTYYAGLPFAPRRRRLWFRPATLPCGHAAPDGLLSFFCLLFSTCLLTYTNTYTYVDKNLFVATLTTVTSAITPSLLSRPPPSSSPPPRPGPRHRNHPHYSSALHAPARPWHSCSSSLSPRTAGLAPWVSFPLSGASPCNSQASVPFNVNQPSFLPKQGLRCVVCRHPQPACCICSRGLAPSGRPHPWTSSYNPTTLPSDPQDAHEGRWGRCHRTLHHPD